MNRLIKTQEEFNQYMEEIRLRGKSFEPNPTTVSFTNDSWDNLEPYDFNKEYIRIVKENNHETIERIMKEKKYVPFVSEVEIFNTTFGKLNNETPTTDIPEFEKKFIYDFILEELEEYKEAYEKDDIVGIADAFGDIMYVLSAGILVYGLKDKFEDIFQEIQASNMSKSCSTEEEAIETVKVRSQEKGYDCHYEKVDDKWIVYRSSDRKAQKSINYFSPNLKKFI